MTDRASHAGPPAELIVAPGARAAEAALLGELERRVPRGIPEAHQAPVRILLPSEPLRQHVCRRLVEHFEHALAGVVVQTLSAFAREVLELAGEAPSTLERGLFELLVRRAAGEEPVMAALLHAQPSASRAIAASVRDLLDAGLGAAQAEAMQEALAGFQGPQALRARALIRCAARLRARIDGWRREMPGPRGESVFGPALARMGDRLARASELLRDPAGEIPATRLALVYGFADATGVASDLLQALAARVPTRVHIDSPPPADEARGGEGETFSARLRERLALPESVAGRGPLARVELLEAASIESEVRAVCERIRRELDGTGGNDHPGARDIGIVTRQPALYAVSLRRHLSRLGIPIDGERFPAPGDPVGRRAGALSELLQQGARLPTERWLDALGEFPPFSVSVELRHALRLLGAGRLVQLAELDLATLLAGRDHVRVSLPAGDDEAEGVAHRQVARAEIEAARELAAQTLAEHRGLEERRPAPDAVEALLDMLTGTLGWDRDSRNSEALLRSIEASLDALPDDLEVERAELSLLVEHVAASRAVGSLAGSGRGVRVSKVLDARGQTYGSLYVLGMNRDVFPRRVSEDPLLLDGLRRVLARELPDLPIKTRGYDEERYLFDMLLASAERVTLSWARLDARGKELARSPLLSRVPGIEQEGVVQKAPPLHDLAALEPGAGQRTALELAILAGLDGRREELAPFLERAAVERRELLDGASGGPGAGDMARGLVAGARELDEGFARRLGPYLGLVGAEGIALADAAPTHVTSVERILECPWKSFLKRALGLESTPDPLQNLPEINRALVGSAVHLVLNRIVRDALGAEAPETLEAALARGPARIEVPSRARLARMAREALERVAQREGTPLGPGAPLLHELVVVFLAGPWRDRMAPERVLGAEVRGEVETASGRRLEFRADRVDRDEEGRTLLIDFKTGRNPITARKRDKEFRRDMLRSISEGKGLQGAAYALGAASAAGTTETRGRYAYLDPDTECPRANELGGDEAALAGEFSRAVEAALGAWEAGELPPRLEDTESGEEPGRCSYCDVADACRRGESGARRRLVTWGSDASSPQRAGGRLWRVVSERHEDAR